MFFVVPYVFTGCCAHKKPGSSNIIMAVANIFKIASSRGMLFWQNFLVRGVAATLTRDMGKSTR